MRKMYVFAAAAVLAFSSCERENVTEPSGSSSNVSTSGVSATGSTKNPIGIDLIGFQFLELCSLDLWTTISGTLVFNITRDGSPQPMGIYNFVLRDPGGILYRPGYELRIEPFSLSGHAGNTNIYKLKFIPHGVYDKKLLALVTVAGKGNDEYTIALDSGALECR